MVAILREADRDPVAVVAKRHGDQRADDLHVAQAFRGVCRRATSSACRQLEAENARLKKLVAERDLEIEVMKEVAAKKW